MKIERDKNEVLHTCLSVHYYHELNFICALKSNTKKARVKNCHLTKKTGLYLSIWQDNKLDPTNFLPQHLM